MTTAEIRKILKSSSGMAQWNVMAERSGGRCSPHLRGLDVSPVSPDRAGPDRAVGLCRAAVAPVCSTRRVFLRLSRAGVLTALGWRTADPRSPIGGKSKYRLDNLYSESMITVLCGFNIDSSGPNHPSSKFNYIVASTPVNYFPRTLIIEPIL